MRRNLHPLVLLLIISTCTPKDQPNPVTIHLNLEGLKIGDVRLVQFDMISLAQSDFDSLTIDEAAGSWQLMIDRPLLPSIKVNDTTYIQLYIEPGQTLSVHGDPHTPSDITFDGDGQHVNAAILATHKLFVPLAGEPFFFQMDLPSFVERRKRLTRELQTILDALEEERHETIVRKIFDSQIRMEELNYVLSHYDLYRGEVVPEALLSYDDPLFDEKLIDMGLASHSMAMMMYYDAVVTRPGWDSTWTPKEYQELAPVAIRDAIEGAPIDQSAKEYLLAQNVYRQLLGNGINDGTERIYQDFIESHPGSVYRPSVMSKYAELTDLRPGNRLPEGLLALTSSGDTTSIDEILGSTITYIDLWATWCGPCLKEFPNAIALHEAYSKEDVSFLYISFDHDIERWREFLREKSVPNGTHVLRLDGDITYQKLQTWGIPRYLLLDRHGLIVDAWAPRPGSVEIRELIDQLL